MQLPVEFIESLRSVKGFDEAGFLAAHDQLAPVSIRINASKSVNDLHQVLMQSGLKIKAPVPWTTAGFYLQERPIFTLDPALHAGAYYVQEASSMFLEYVLSQVLKDENGLKVLDLCAAPGGKTTLLAGMKHFKLVLANEIIRTRVNILYENVVKWGDPKIFISNNDPAHFSGLPEYFDVMLVDAPCSGSGLFRKDQEAIHEWSTEQVMHCAERQKRILLDALPALKQGGILVYSTCSYSIEEDEAIMDFLMENASLDPVDIAIPEGWGIVKTSGAKGGFGYRFFPDKTPGEGFFISCFRLKAAVEAKTSHTRKKMNKTVNAEVPATWLNKNVEVESILAGEEIYCIPMELVADHISLREVLNIRKSGVKAGAMGRNDFIPDHELILSSLVAEDAPRMNLNRQKALQYLRKQVFEPGHLAKGWYIASYEGFAMGLVKHLGNRLNNYYPASWRILMS